MPNYQKRLFDPDTLESLLPKLVHPTLEPPQILALMSVDDIYSDASQELLESLKEDRRIERKPGGTHLPTITEYVCMWANTPPDGGLIIFGMNDDGSWAGCGSLDQKVLNRLENPKELCPDAPCETKRVPLIKPDGSQDFAVLARVRHPRHLKRVVRTTGGEVWTRRGDQKKKLTDSEILNLQIDIGEVDFEQLPCALEYPKEFDSSAIRQFGDTVRSVLELSPGVSDEEILATRHLGELTNGKFTPNIACALLFANEPDRLLPGCKIRFFRFDGTTEGSGEKFNAVKDIWVEGVSVPKLISRAADVIEAQIRTFGTLGSDGRFYTQPEYPKAAWYEAIVNACAHRSYGNGLRNMTIYVRMFDDRLEIESPGGFLPFVNPDNIYGTSCPRNPKLMRAMYFMKIVKMASEGTRRMRDTMAAMGLPSPEFSQKEIDHTKVRVTLRNDAEHRKKWVDKDAVAIVGAALAKTLTDTEKRMLNFVAEHKALNVTQAVRLTGLDWNTAKKALTRLEDMGILERRARDDLDRDPKAKYVLPGTPRD